MNKTDALIIGAGLTGLFTAHQLKLIGLDCEIVDNLDKIGGQCIELYPDKPIYDIPAVPECTGEELTNNLINQLKPFSIKFHLSERVDEVKKDGDNWIVKTSNGTTFQTPNVIIAGGVGSFEPRKFSVKECEKFENKSVLYSIKDKMIFEGKTVSIFGGGDSALDWAVELSKNSKVNLDTFFLLSTNFSFLNYVNSLVCVNLLINCSNFHAMHYQVFVLNEKFFFL